MFRNSSELTEEKISVLRTAVLRAAYQPVLELNISSDQVAAVFAAIAGDIIVETGLAEDVKERREYLKFLTHMAAAAMRLDPEDTVLEGQAGNHGEEGGRR